MRATRVIASIDSHTEGMTTRVITSGLPPIPGRTQMEKRLYAEHELDDVRRLLMYEPRGHRAMSGAILTDPCDPDADFGVVFIEVSGFLPMCGHGTIGVATVLVESGMVEVREPITCIALDTPAGLVQACVQVHAGRAISVTISNVPSFVEVRDLVVQLPGGRAVSVDVAYGGNFYAVVPASALDLSVDPPSEARLIDSGMELLFAVNAAYNCVHPQLPEIRGCRHAILTDDGTSGAQPGVAGRSAVVVHPGWLDRSPCGTGTSARMALLHNSGDLLLEQEYVHEGILGTRFVGRLTKEASVGRRRAVMPTITGTAYLTAISQFLLDPKDPFPAGFLLGKA